eukprot:3218210-Lingulodinium_polyedra.AAC.1
MALHFPAWPLRVPGIKPRAPVSENARASRVFCGPKFGLKLLSSRGGGCSCKTSACSLGDAAGP